MCNDRRSEGSPEPTWTACSLKLGLYRTLLAEGGAYTTGILGAIRHLESLAGAEQRCRTSLHPQSCASATVQCHHNHTY